jgi:PAS domain S-box-containing protein
MSINVCFHDKTLHQGMHLCISQMMVNGTKFPLKRIIRVIPIMPSQKHFLLCILLTVITLSASSQRYNFSNYTIVDGLQSNQINDIIQDRSGRLWIGTMNGAVSYDGQIFNYPSIESSIANNPVKTIFEDKHGNIWFGTVRKGLVRFGSGVYKSFTANDGMLSDNVNAVCDDKDTNIWIGTTEGLSRYRNKKFVNFTTSQGLVGNSVNDLLYDKNNILWVATSGGLSGWNGEKFTNYTVKEGLISNVIFTLEKSRDGKLWMGTYQGVSVLENGKITNITIEDGLPNVRVEDIIEDAGGNMWFATNGGLAKLHNGKISYINVGQGVNSNIIKSIIEDREGNYWLGTWNGIFKYNGDRFISYTIEDGLSNNNVLSIFSDKANKIWIGTLTGGINIFEHEAFSQITTSEGLKSSTIWCINQDKSGKYWLGTTNGPFRYNDSLNLLESPFPELQNQIIYAVLSDQSGNVLFGTDKGVYIYNGTSFSILNASTGLTDEKVRVLHQDNTGVIWIGTLKGAYYIENNKPVSLNVKYKLPDGPVTSIVSDKKGDLLISIYDFGILVYSRTPYAASVRQLNRKNGLKNERVNFCFLDSRRKLWLGSPEGLDCIDWDLFRNQQKISLIHYDKGNGYLGVESNAATEDQDGNIWFGTINGVIRFSPDAAVVRSTLPSVFISKIQLFYEDVEWKKNKIKINRVTGLPENLVLAYNNNHLSFIFSGIYLTAPDEVQYRFMLEGFEDDWSPATKLNFANYSNLPAGEFTFKVQATANQREWSVPVTYSFAIKPPFWKTPFFYLLYIAFSVGAVWLGYNLRTRALRRRSEMLRQTVNSRTKELQEKNLELAKLSLVASETDNAVMIFNSNQELEWVNTGFTKLTGYSLAEIRKSKRYHLKELTSNALISENLDECITERRSFIYESELLNKEGRQLWTSSTLTPILNENGFLSNIVVIDTDITLRKQMEEQIRASLEERGVLLREIHHRVKNNLQIIISLFNLQTHYVQDVNASKALREGQNRIKSMALIHERFYQSDGLSKIDFDDYIRRLTDNLLQTSGITSDRVILNIISEKISLDIDTAVPCGLIINEVVSNSIKHAFNDGRKGEIMIRFSYLNESEYRLEIGDNGVGLPADYILENSDSLGIQLIHALTDQIDGKLSVDSTNGVKYTIDFKTIHK